jgi:hypothetical protein
MKKIILNKDQYKILEKLVSEQEDRYMFFSNLEQIRDQANELLKYDRNKVEQLLDDGHDWAQDHVASSTESIDQVYDFMKNNFNNETNMIQEQPMLTNNMKSSIECLKSIKKDVSWQEVLQWFNENNIDYFGMNDLEMYIKYLEERSDSKQLQVQEGRKKTGTKLCARGKSAAKAKFDVYPSAYANGYAVQVCKGKVKGLDGKKRCSPPYC